MNSVHYGAMERPKHFLMFYRTVTKGRNRKGEEKSEETRVSEETGSVREEISARVSIFEIFFAIYRFRESLW